MKRILVVALTVFVLASSVFAADVSELDPSINTSLSALTDSSYPHSARSLGMGSAGVAVGGRSDSFYMNPALLARRTLISLPYAQVSLYHPYDLLKKNESTGTSIVDDIMDAMNSGEMTDIAGPATGFLQTIKSGKGKLAEVEAGINLGGGGFALGLHVKDTIHTFGNGVGGLDANLFDELNVNILAALGLRFDITPSISIDVGISSGVSVLGYSGLIGAQSALDMMGGSESGSMEDILAEVPLAFGWTVPLNVGLNVNLPLGFSVGAVGRNLLGSAVGYKMQVTDIDAVMSDAMGIVSNTFSEKADFTLKMDPSFDLGFGWKWENGFFSPTVALDFVDFIDFFSNEMNMRSFVEHLRIGAEFRLLSVLDVRAGINQGYWTLGAGIDLWAIKIDAAYYWQEFGETLGDYGLDAFTIRFNLGFDR